MIEEACELLYGQDGRGGLAKLKGTRYADAICMGYLQAQEWAEIADIMQCFRSNGAANYARLVSPTSTA